MVSESFYIKRVPIQFFLEGFSLIEVIGQGSSQRFSCQMGTVDICFGRSPKFFDIFILSHGFPFLNHLKECKCDFFFLHHHFSIKEARASLTSCMVKRYLFLSLPKVSSRGAFEGMPNFSASFLAGMPVFFSIS